MTGISVESLYRSFEKSAQTLQNAARKLIFHGVPGRDVYNITAPFEDGARRVIAGRVEARNSEHSEVVFFEEHCDEWHPIKDAPRLALQDPFVTRIQGRIILGGVEIFEHPQNPGNLWWRTVFYKGRDIFELQRFAAGPDGMKDIRLVQRKGKIGVFTRPQHPQGELGSGGGRGKIGYIEISSLQHLTPQNIAAADILEQLSDEDWLGANEVHKLQNGHLGVLCHIARYDTTGERHYYAAAFIFEPETMRHSEIRIIAARKMFQPGPSKRPDLADVVFPGGLLRKENSAQLYVGTGDAEAQVIEIADPFGEGV